MIATITIEAKNQAELLTRLNQIKQSIQSGDIEDNQLMDGSYQVAESNIEIDDEVMAYLGQGNNRQITNQITPNNKAQD